MKSYKDIVQQLEEAAAASQNSTAEVQMNEDHLVHVNDGSKYDEQPHEKDVEHVMSGVKKHGGEHAGASDKGVFFKFKSAEHASNFVSHVNKCPHRSCDAHMSESVDYDKPTYLRNNPKEPTKKSSWTGFNTDEPAYKRKEQAELEKKRLNKEEAEQIDELDKKTIGSYAKKATKDLKWQQTMRPFDAKRISNREKGIDRAIDKLTKEEVEQVDESSLHRQHFQMVADLIRGHESAEKRKELAHHHAELFKKANPRFDHAKFMKAAGVNEEVQVEAKVYDPFTKKMVATKPIKVQAGGGATRNGVPVETGPSKYKQSLNKEETVTEDVDKAAIKKQYKDNESNNNHTENAALLAKHFGSKRDQNQVAKAKAYRDKHNGYGGDILGRHHANLAHEIHKKLYDKLHEEAEQIDELSKDTLASYAKKASHDARIKQHVAADFKSKEAHARNPRKKETWGSIAKKYQSKAWKREDGHDKAVDKLAKEEVQIDEISKSTLMRYIPKATRDTADHVAQAKDHQLRQIDATAAGNWDAAKVSNERQKKSFWKAHSRIHGVDRAVKKLGTQKEEVQVDEAAHVYDTKTGKVHSTHDTYKKAVNAMNKLNKELPGYDTPGGLEQSKFGAKLVKESRGHKVIATFLKNREVAQRAYNGNPAKDAEVAQGGGSPADQGIAAAKADYKKMNKEAVNPALMAIMKRRQAAQDKKETDKKKLSEDQYTSEYKIKQFVDPVTGENKQRKIRPHRVNFGASKMHGEPAQKDASGDYGLKEDDKVYDEKWKKFNFKNFKKGAK